MSNRITVSPLWIACMSAILWETDLEALDEGLTQSQYREQAEHLVKFLTDHTDIGLATGPVDGWEVVKPPFRDSWIWPIIKTLPTGLALRLLGVLRVIIDEDGLVQGIRVIRPIADVRHASGDGCGSEEGVVSASPNDEPSGETWIHHVMRYVYQLEELVSDMERQKLCGFDRKVVADAFMCVDLKPDYVTYVAMNHRFSSLVEIMFDAARRHQIDVGGDHTYRRVERGFLLSLLYALRARQIQWLDGPGLIKVMEVDPTLVISRDEITEFIRELTGQSCLITEPDGAPSLIVAMLTALYEKGYRPVKTDYLYHGKL